VAKEPSAMKRAIVGMLTIAVLFSSCISSCLPVRAEDAPDETASDEAALSEAVRASGEATALDSISVSLFGPGCGETIDHTSGDNNTYADVEEWETASVSESYWVLSYSRDDYTALEGTIEGGQEYTAYIVVRPADGYRFAEGIHIEANGEALSAEDLLRAEGDRIVCVVRVTAVHSYDESYDVEPTCKEGGILRYTCYGNPFVVRIEQKDAEDPGASDSKSRRGASGSSPVPRGTSPDTGDSAHTAFWLLFLLLAGWGVRRMMAHLFVSDSFLHSR